MHLLTVAGASMLFWARLNYMFHLVCNDKESLFFCPNHVQTKNITYKNNVIILKTQ